MGLWHGEHRLAVTRGANDGENRARAVSLTVQSGPSAAAPSAAPAAAPAAPPPPPTVMAARAEGLRVDGRLDEASWQSTTPTRAFVSTVDGSPAELRAEAKLLWDDQNLYVGFDVRDTYLRNTLTGRDAHLWEQDAVEIMVDPDGDGRNYYELQVSPTGEVFDTRYDSRRVPGPIGHADWNAALTARVAIGGTANDDADDVGYTVEIAIPWSAFADAEGAPLAAPAPGSSWRMNFYAMDTMRSGSRSAGWSATHERDFHVPARFGRVTFAAPAPVAEAAPAPAAADSRTALVEATPRAALPAPSARMLKRALRASAPGADLIASPARPTVQ
jgi:hypothetical protein